MLFSDCSLLKKVSQYLENVNDVIYLILICKYLPWSVNICRKCDKILYRVALNQCVIIGIFIL
jgi:hypothetical protein